MKLIKRTNESTPALNNVFDHFFNDAFLNWPAKSTTGKWNNLPAVNITENEEGFTLDLAAPGMKKEDFKIELDADLLTISSEKKEEKTEEKENFTRREFGFSSFRRSFHLPEDSINEEDIKASYENGVLRLSLPKREEAKPQPAKFIEIS